MASFLNGFKLCIESNTSFACIVFTIFIVLYVYKVTVFLSNLLSPECKILTEILEDFDKRKP